MIVIDLGAAEHHHLQPDGSYEVESSIEQLVERFDPDVLYGYDPWYDHPQAFSIGSTRVLLSPRAAWIHDGFLGYARQSSRSRVFESDAATVPCFDLADFIEGLQGEIVLKLDVEGAEYPLLTHLHARGIDKKLSLVLVEWHDVATIPLACPVEEWDHQTVSV